MQAVLLVYIFRGWVRVKIRNFKYSFSSTAYWSMIILGKTFKSDYKMEVIFEVFTEWLPPIKATFDRQEVWEPNALHFFSF